jgi:hypothetical protein
MKSSELNEILHGKLSGKDLRSKIDSEVSSYTKLMEKKGASIPIIFNEDAEIIINQVAIKILLQATIIGHLTNVHLAYICDCLTLGEKVNFENEKVKDLVFEIADPEINGDYKSNSELEVYIKSI